jgi:hypothetical protein
MNINTSTNGDMCLANSATIHTILKENKYFSYLEKWEININTIFETTKIIEGSGRANVSLYGGTNLLLKMHYIPQSLK